MKEHRLQKKDSVIDMYQPVPAAANKFSKGLRSNVPWFSTLTDMLTCISTARAAAKGKFGNVSCICTEACICAWMCAEG